MKDSPEQLRKKAEEMMRLALDLEEKEGSIKTILQLMKTSNITPDEILSAHKTNRQPSAPIAIGPNGETYYRGRRPVWLSDVTEEERSAMYAAARKKHEHPCPITGET